MRPPGDSGTVTAVKAAEGDGLPADAAALSGEPGAAVEEALLDDANADPADLSGDAAGENIENPENTEGLTEPGVTDPEEPETPAEPAATAPETPAEPGEASESTDPEGAAPETAAPAEPAQEPAVTDPETPQTPDMTEMDAAPEATAPAEPLSPAPALEEAAIEPAQPAASVPQDNMVPAKQGQSRNGTAVSGKAIEAAAPAEAESVSVASQDTAETAVLSEETAAEPAPASRTASVSAAEADDTAVTEVTADAPEETLVIEEEALPDISETEGTVSGQSSIAALTWRGFVWPVALLGILGMMLYQEEKRFTKIDRRMLKERWK